MILLPVSNTHCTMAILLKRSKWKRLSWNLWDFDLAFFVWCRVPLRAGKSLCAPRCKRAFWAKVRSQKVRDSWLSNGQSHKIAHLPSATNPTQVSDSSHHGVKPAGHKVIFWHSVRWVEELLTSANPPVERISTWRYLNYLIKLTEWLGVIWTLASTSVSKLVPATQW